MNAHESPKSRESEFANENPKPLLRTVLLVDDTDASRITTKWFLTNFGFVVESARTAQEALALFDPKTHDLVITDNTMPGMTGLELAHITKLRSPSTPVLMISGSLPEDRTCLDFVMQKPVHLLTLKEALDRILSGSPSLLPTNGSAA